MKKPLISRLFKFSLATAFGGVILLPASKAVAAPNLVVYPLGWNVIGLDSNKVTDGPNKYLMGARVCNTGTTAATNVTAKFVETNSNSYVSLVNNNDTLTTTSLPAGTTSPKPGDTGTLPSNCYDFYFNVQVTRDSNAYSSLNTSSSRQQFRVDVSADSVSTISTPSNRELYVEKLVSQNRNGVDSISGPSVVFKDQIVQYTVVGHTATGGYEQLVFLPELPVFFQLLSVQTTYSNPSGAKNNSVYGDACGWENDYTNTSYYHNNGACSNPAISDGYSGGKVGNTVTTVYTIKVLGTGSGTLTNVIYDYSGSSYHYNTDYGTGINSFTVDAVNPVSGLDLRMDKTHSGYFAKGVNGQFNLNVVNVGTQSTSGTITVEDTLPSQLDYVSATGTGWSCSYNSSNRKVTCTSSSTLASQSSSTITLIVKPNTTTSNNGTFTNTATVSISGDTVSTNNTDTDSITVGDPVDLSITKTADSSTVSQGGTVTYTMVIKNNSTSTNVDGAKVEDTLDSIFSNITVNSCTTSGSDSCTTSVSGNNVSATLKLAKGNTVTLKVTATASSTATGTISNTGVVSNPTGVVDSDSSNNSSTANVNVTAPDLKITKTHTSNISINKSGTFTLAVQNIGFATTSGTITVVDTLPTGLDYVSATGTNWSCSYDSSTRKVTCTTSSTLASTASSTITLTVKRTSNTSLTNQATVSNTGDKNSSNDSATDTLPATTNLLLVKRITAINGVTTNPNDSTDLSKFVNDSGSTNDDDSYWPTPTNTYLPGAISGGYVKPGDIVEYTIYFLNTGATAKNVTVCDLVPTNQTFVQTTYTSTSGIGLALNSTTLPTAPNTLLTNDATDSDAGYYYAANNASTPSVCQKFDSSGTAISSGQTANTDGAIVVKVVTGTTTLPSATAAGTPTNSYGFVRFRATVK